MFQHRAETLSRLTNDGTMARIGLQLASENTR
jgi:hypothetical protein